ncbi:MBL fold metallo-hydrolase [Aureimonas pseudogalii]|uniref:L-ascorbate metabolism protein UlaG (Beta-lactamase superfamily) n=1 Tax=Aureimonas pseudogalii TaxID=1744844 RepID=A0A7W6H6I9_9HYPH|nr:MBL fold metallo-hydrolase [Aureimonas pseudogalii]MBB3999451.1 L-ascorbate metabolism protein UlaG (beta-lactamase superfamily) [Aureimonas pseudogalii]
MNKRKFLKLAAFGGAASIGAGAAAKVYGASARYQGPISDHFDGTRFFNPGGTEPNGFGDLLRWRLNGERATWPEAWPEAPRSVTPEARVSGDTLRVTMIGHASLLIQTEGLNILTDPVYSDRASPVAFAGPKRVNAPGVPFERLPPIDLVLLTHNHYDHMDLDTLARLKAAHDPLVVTPLGNDLIVAPRVPGLRMHVQDWGDTFSLGAFTVHCEPTHHWSARGLLDRRKALWSSFVVEGPAGRIYHVGDTGFHSGINYREAQRRHGSFRLACLPIGAYEPRWFMKPQHQNPAEAVEGFKLLGSPYAVGHHWGTFQLTDEAIEAPRTALRSALDDAAIAQERFRPLIPGETWDVPPVA